jgi:diguanylate cyclase (GGDEF)-like protein/PAS domain S-box-containing protein
MRGILDIKPFRELDAIRLAGACLVIPLDNTVWETAEWVRTVLDTSDCVVLATDAEGTIRYCNAEVTQLFGYEPSELLGRSPLQVLDRADLARRAPADNGEPGLDVLFARAKRGQADDREWLLVRKDGSKFSGRVTIRAASENGERIFVLVIHDATEGRRVEQALRESEQRFKGAFEHSPVGMALVSPDGYWLQANTALCRMLGYSEAELKRITFAEISHPDDLNLSITSDRELLGGKSDSYQIQKRYVRKDGQIVWAMVNASLVRGPDRRPLHFVAQIVDVTDQRQAEEARRETEERFRDLFENASDLIQCAGPDGRLQYVNRAWREKLGYSEEQIAGLSLMDIVHPDSLVEFMKSYELALRGKKVGAIVARFMAKTGEVIVVEGDISCSFRDERPVLVRGMFRDITDRKRYEELLDEYRRDLEAANARLEQANIRLRELATTDALTGLYNRLVFQRRLEDECKRSGRYGTPMSLILIDVDHFKSFNDTFGHPAGDETLQIVSRLLRSVARATDVVARFGGEEFAVVCPNTDLAGAVVVAERCRQAVEAASWKWRPVTVSAGVAQFTPDMPDATALVSAADRALYQAKNNGRNRVEK